MTGRSRAVALALVLVASAARPAGAQTTRSWELFAGYAVAHVSPDAVTLPAGWNVSVARPVTPWLAAVGDLGGCYKNEAIFDGTLRLATYDVLGGARVSAKIGRFAEFGQLLAGVVRNTGSVFDVTDTTTSAAIQPGAGLDYPITRALAARTGIDLQLTARGHQWRFATGIVIRLY